MNVRPLSPPVMPPPVLHRVEGSGAGTRWAAAVVIPARNEGRRIGACLNALADAIAFSGHTVGVIICVNDTTDDTAKQSAALLRTRGVPNLVLDLHFLPGTGGVGRVRDLGMKLSQRLAHPPPILMTTDADSRVCPGWVAANIAELAGVDVVFGSIVADPEELAGLHPRVARNAVIETQYTRAAVRLASLLDPLTHDPAPEHRSTSGASIALSADAFARLGGVPWLPLSEDRALAGRAEALDLRIRHASAPQVVTSCRLNGRAAGGMASTLRARCAEDDPLCDDWLESTEMLVRRHYTKGRLRALWPAPASAAAVVHELLGPGADAHPLPHPAGYETFGAFWQALESTHPALARQPLRHSDAALELPRLLARLRQIDGPQLDDAFSEQMEIPHALPAQ